MHKAGLIMLMKKFRMAVYRPDDQFVLTSGKKSPYYFDCKSALMCGDTAALIFTLLFKKLNKLQPTAIGGPANGAYLMVANAAVGYQRCRGFVFRKEQKEHGLKSIVDGRLPKEAGKRMVLVDDVITTGKSLVGIAEYMAKEHELVGIIPVVDRNEGDELGEFRKLVQPLLVKGDFEPWDEPGPLVG